jgi:SAM-dependent methyltransferase
MVMTANSRPTAAYRAFWNHVGARLPSFKGAASTRYYAECEQLLYRDLFPSLAGRSLLKTDLWDEAENSEILCWAAAQGAHPFGIDIASDVVHEARSAMHGFRPRFAVADVRFIPFVDNTFDLVYSMGTIEHFPEYSQAVAEIFRVLKPGGIAIIGVPNKLDPFLRPLLVTLLNHLNLYAYGREKAFTIGELRALLEATGFEVVGCSGILFMPGWLRMLDLLLHICVPRLVPLVSWLVQPFAWLYRHVPAVRRHGYLIALAARKPAAPVDQ